MCSPALQYLRRVGRGGLGGVCVCVCAYASLVSVRVTERMHEARSPQIMRRIIE